MNDDTDTLASAGVDASTPILVLRRSFASLQHAVLGVARSAGRLGIPVHAVRMSRREPATRSRYIAGGFELPADAPDERWLETLLRFGAERPRTVLLPIDDASAIFAGDHRESLLASYVMPRPKAGAHRLLASKRALWELCHRIGIPSPESRFPRSEQEARDCGELFGYPVVLKRADPWLVSNDPLAPSVEIAGTEGELIDCYRRMESPVYPQVMVQEYIPGGPETVWMFNGYFGGESRCLCAFTGQKIRQRGPRTGPTTLGICIWNESVVHLAQLLARDVEYQGIVDMGFRYDARDGQYKLLDVNPRMGSTFRLFAGSSGVDVVRAAYLDLTGQSVPATRLREGRKWIVEPYDLLTSAQIRGEGALSLGAWLRSLRGVEEAAWWARDDPVPFLSMAASLGPLAIRYRRRRRLGHGAMPTPAAGTDLPASQPV